MDSRLNQPEVQVTYSAHSRLENLSVQILQGLLAGRQSAIGLDKEQAKGLVKWAVNIAEMLIKECDRVERSELEDEAFGGYGW